MNEVLKVLIVDDEFDRMAVKRSLTEANVNVELSEIETCEAAIIRLQQEAFDAVLLDYHLPDADGLYFVRRVQQLGISVPMIVLTGQGDEEVAVELMKAGVYDYLSKSKIAPDPLARSLLTAVRLHRAEVQAAGATQRLRESEERYRLVLEGANDGIWDWYICQNELFCNERLFEIVGISREQLGTAYEAFYRLIHPDDRSRVLRAIAVHLEEGRSFDVEFRVQHASGQYRYCASRGKAQRDKTGRLFRMSGILSDITERKQAEAEISLRVNQQAAIAQLGQLALSGTPLSHLMDEAMTLVAQGLQVPYAKVTEQLPEQDALLVTAGIGWREGLVGQTLLPTQSESQSGYTLLSGRPVISEDADREERFSRPALHYEHHLVSGVSVIIQTQEGPYGVLSAHSDSPRHFTQEDVNFLQAIANILASAIDQHRSEVALRQSERDLQRRVEELQTLFDVIPIGIAIAEDPACRQIRVNPTYAEMLSIAPDANASKSAPESERSAYRLYRHGQELLPQELPMQVAAIEGKPVLDSELEIVREDGKTLSVLSYTTPLFDEHNHPRGCIGAFLDITERKRNEAVQQFLARASSVLASSLDYNVILDSIATLAVPTLADCCFFDLVMPNGKLQRVTWKHADSTKQDWFSQIQHYIPPLNHHLHPVRQCLSTEQAIFVPEVSDEWLQAVAFSSDHLQFMRGLGCCSLMTVPLLVHGRKLGVLTFCLTIRSQRHYTRADLRLAEDLAQRAAFALDNAQLYRTTQEAERNLRQALIILGQHQQQLRTLQRLTDLLNQRLTNLPGLLRVMVDAICEAIPNAEFGLIVLQNPYTGLLEVTALSGTGGERFQPDRAFAPGEGLLGEIFLTGESQLIQMKRTTELDSPDAKSSLPDRTKADPTSEPLPAALCAVAIESAQAGRLGVLAIGNWSNATAFDDENLHLLVAFGEQAAIALTNAQLINALEEREERLAIQNRILGEQNRELERQRQQIQLQNLQLREVAQMKSQFMATMSHELRTPMNAVIGFSQLLLRQQHQLTSQQVNMIERIFNNGKHLLALINDILDFSKIEAGRLELVLEDLNLAKLVKATADELRSLAEQKDLPLHVHLNLSNPMVSNDSTRLRQILVNLLSNAIKFTDSGFVRVAVEEVNPDRLAISVQDTGIGIAPENLEHIFEAFRQVDQTLAKKFPGTGLGLAITDLLVSMMHGTITVESDVGQGSTFRVEFPRRLEEQDRHQKHSGSNRIL